MVQGPPGMTVRGPPGPPGPPGQGWLDYSGYSYSGKQGLKGQCNEIFNLFIFAQKTVPRPHINRLKRFCKLVRFREDIR